MHWQLLIFLLASTLLAATTNARPLSIEEDNYPRIGSCWLRRDTGNSTTTTSCDSGSSTSSTTSLPSSSSLIPTSTPSFTPTSLSPAPSATACAAVPEWGQCGGIGYSGPTVCASPYNCNFLNTFYSQCY
ncbi:hypothetical protein BV25DRAFT_1912728 [Artomyces pyxidatus]|uniref:Uncharacterized protein n=1 Tax=Artomyces pyxidatus TaxID=48021 RepID=A0ACB8TE32_9AGAM|nr:hypothetical protein BV25DRAFT_1912728 [Artomyces pyxidatus]